MINKGQINAEEMKIQSLIDSFLRFRSAKNNFRGSDNHLDDDSLTAFIEGKISERESPRIIEHLVNCSFCLHVTGELVKLNDAFAENEVTISAAAKEPTKVSEVLSGLLSRLFGTSDAAVFAHEEKKEEDKEEEEDNEKIS